MNHEEFKKEWLGKGFAETKDLGFQCVGGVKKYCKEVFGINLGSFGGTAYNGFITGNPFKNYKFQKIINTPSFIPKKGDIIFFDKHKQNGFCGHVGVVDNSTVKEVKVLNQNMGTGTGKDKSDGFRISNFDFINPKCLGVYRFIG